MIKTVKCKNNYQLEGSEVGTWTLKVKDKDNIVTDLALEQLKDFKEPIYFNDTSAEHWIFDFNISDIWFEAVKVDCNKMTMTLNAYQ